MRKYTFLKYETPQNKQFDILKFGKAIAHKHAPKNYRFNRNIYRDGWEEVSFPLIPWANFQFFVKRKANIVEVGAELSTKGDTGSRAFHQIYFEMEKTILSYVQKCQSKGQKENKKEWELDNE